MDRSFCLSVDSPALQAIGSLTVADGLPVQRFLKKVIPTGKFVKRNQSTNEKLWELDVTTERQQKWVDAFNAMKTAGVAVRLADDTGNFTLDAPKAPITKDHAGAFDKSKSNRLKRMAESIVAETVDMFISDDGWVTATVEAKGQPAIDFLKTAKFTSPEIDPCYIDGTDKKHGEAITAISIVARPLVPGQTGFVETLAASEDCERYVLSLDNFEVPQMNTLLAQIASMAGLPIDALKTEQAGVDALKTNKAKQADTQDKLTKALSEDEPNVALLGREAKYMARELDGLKDVLSDAGIKALKKQFIGEPKKKEFAPYILSLDEGDDGAEHMAAIAKIIRENLAVKKGAKTEIQNTKVLSEDGTEKPPEITESRLRELLSGSTTGREYLNANGKR